MELIWHYTSNLRAEEIFKDQILKVSEAEKSFGMKPAIWFSKNQIWEPTATKMVSDGKGNIDALTIEEQLKMIGMVRFGIKFTKELVSWTKYKYLSGLTLQVYNSMTEEGKKQGGNPNHWYCLFKPVGAIFWIKVEEYDGEKWENILSD